jgi:site-specific DNA-cytosine methylase
MKILELFSGTHSVGNVCKKLNYEVVSLDIDGNADININILEWDYKKAYPKGYFDIIWASPPCVSFSLLRRSWIGRKTKYFGDKIITKEMIDEDMINNGLPILNKTIEIIEYFKPNLYFIENPKTGRMKEFIDLPYYDVDYCKYGFNYRKPTRVWTNKKDFDALVCKKDCHAIIDGKHKEVIGSTGSKSTRKIRYRVPHKLIQSLLA